MESKQNMLPSAKANVYPRTKENIRALMYHYLGKLNLTEEDVVDSLYEYRSLELNQIEFIARKLFEGWNEIFKSFFPQGTTMKNLMRYGINGLAKQESEWDCGPYSSARPKIKEFIAFVERTEMRKPL